MIPTELYIHIPFCVKKCDYCDFLSAVFPERIQNEYALCLCNEIEFISRLYPNREIISIYIGGGTPSWLSEDLMDKILNTVYRSFNVNALAEISIECNPGTLSSAKLNVYRSIGINRLSIGLQSANDDELKELGRIHDYNRFLHTYDLVRKAGFDNVNVDIMTGLPHQTMNKLEHTLSSVAMLRPEHVSAYSLIIEEGTPFYEKYKFDAVKQRAGMPTDDGLPSDEETYNLYKLAINYLENKGYKRYEISNYARNGKECIHNIGYWNRTSYIGVGLGSASLINEKRASNITDIYKYMKIAKNLENALEESQFSSPFYASENVLSKKEGMEEFMYLGLRKMEGVRRSDFKDMFGCDIEGVYGPIIKALCAKGFLQIGEGRIFLTDVGIDVSNQVLAKFLLD